MQVKDLLGRADETVLQRLLGRPAVQLLALFDEGNVRPRLLRETLMRLRSPQSLLTDPQTRGELLSMLHLDEARDLMSALGQAPCGDPFAELRQMRIRTNSSIEQDLLTHFELVRTGPDAGPDISGGPVECEYSLRPYQRSLVSRGRDALSRSARLLIHMPTGAGKTRTAMSLICDLLRQSEPGVVVWLAHSEELCQQAFEEFQRAWSALGNRELTMARFWGNAADSIDELRDGFVVAGLSKTYEGAIRDIDFIAQLGDRTCLVVMDEAHQAIAQTYALVLDALEGKRPSTRLIGLTATPGRSFDDPEENEQLARFWNRCKVGIQVEGFDNPVDFLVSEGFLARPTFSSLFYSGTGLSDADEREMARSLDIPLSVLQRVGDDAKRNLQIVRATEILLTRHQRAIVFAPSVQSAELLAAVLVSRGSHASAITSRTPMSERSRTIASFKSNSESPMVICNYAVLTTGFDVPRTSAALIARPTRSLVLYTQMVGRAVRGKHSGGNDTAEIVTVVDRELPGFADFGEAFMHWEEPWT